MRSSCPPLAALRPRSDNLWQDMHTGGLPCQACARRPACRCIDARLAGGVSGARANLSVGAGQSRCAVRRGRRHRHSGSRVLRPLAAKSRPAVHGREPRRRGRPDRRDGGSPFARRWLDPDVHHRRADHHRAADERQGAVRSAQGLRADCRGRGDAGLAGGQRQFAAQVGGRHHQQRQGQSRQAQLRHLRRRHRAASCGGGGVPLGRRSRWCMCRSAAAAR